MGRGRQDSQSPPRRGGGGRNGRSASRGGHRGREPLQRRSRSPAGRARRERSSSLKVRKGPGMASQQAMTAPQSQANAKKMRKDAIKRELGYSDESNPFGDNTLTQKFVWKKKNEYLNAAGLYQKSDKQQQTERVEAKLQEIQRVKVRRDEREVEKQLLEKQRLEHNKERIQEDFDEWTHKEEHFHLEQAKTRSNLRIEQGRERPIDLVSKSLAIAEGETFDDMTILDKYPHMAIPNMNAKDVQSMADDVYHFLRIETNPVCEKFWKAMQFVLKDCLDSKSASSQKAALGRIGAGIAEGVQQDVHELLSSKKRPELEEMHVEIKESLKIGGDGVDTQFFDAVSKKLPLYMARADIEDVHDRATSRVQAWRAAGGGGKVVEKEGYETGPPVNSDDDISIADGDITGGEDEEPDEKKGDWDDLPEDNQNPQGGDFSPDLEPLENHNEDGAFSPILEPLNKFDTMDLIDPDEDERMRREIRNTLNEGYRGARDDPDVDRSNDDKMFEAEKARGMGADEAGFNLGMGADEHGEVALNPKRYEWEDKYKPRKPRFFNRVKTGYEWNKYNQTHYDHDNPPPKVVQGYKFNIFYPDLINKTMAPTYVLQKSQDGDPKETVTLRFTAGPPYEDVAFKIVNRQWNMSHKFGFRCVFERGVLQLYFNFHRWRYRR